MSEPSHPLNIRLTADVINGTPGHFDDVVEGLPSGPIMRTDLVREITEQAILENAHRKHVPGYDNPTPQEQVLQALREAALEVEEAQRRRDLIATYARHAPEASLSPEQIAEAARISRSTVYRVSASLPRRRHVARVQAEVQDALEQARATGRMEVLEGFVRDHHPHSTARS